MCIFAVYVRCVRGVGFQSIQEELAERKGKPVFTLRRRHWRRPTRVRSCVSPPSFPLQITVYLGKRDFVDHASHVDPIGECYTTLQRRSADTLHFGRRHR